MKVIRPSEAAVGGGKICRPQFAVRNFSAFTLIELLVVISILGLLAALTVPAIKNLGKSNITTSAARQMLDDVGRARQLAVSQHTTVYMVFVPTNFFNLPCALGNVNYPDLLTGLNNITSASDKQSAFSLLTNLVEKQFSGYNFVSFGNVGDQPGRHDWHYIDSWRTLPDDSFIAAQKFSFANSPMQIPQWQLDYPNSDQNLIPAFTNNVPVPFPTEASPVVYLPYIAFDYTGRLVSQLDSFGRYHDAYIPLAQGRVSYGYDQNKAPQPTTVNPADVSENPPGNSTGISYHVVHIDALTGRATLEYFKIK